MRSLDNIVAKGLAKTRAVFGTSIIYAQGAKSAPLKCMKGRSNFTSADPSGVTIEQRTTDFLVSTREFKSRGFVDPKKGDTITEHVGGQKFTYAVNRPDGGQAWQFEGGAQSQMRLHGTLKANP